MTSFIELFFSLKKNAMHVDQRTIWKNWTKDFLWNLNDLSVELKNNVDFNNRKHCNKKHDFFKQKSIEIVKKIMTSYSQTDNS